MEEVWKQIEGIQGYLVSNLGRIKSIKREKIRNNGKPLTIPERIVRGSKDTKGYLQLDVKQDGKRIIKFIHRIVAETFIPNPDNKQQVNHIDGNKLNNSVENLEWVTCEENIHHAWEKKLNKPLQGEKHGNAKLTDEQVRYIRKHYIPRDKEYGASALGRKFGTTIAPIYQVIHGKGWKHVV